MQVGPQSHSHGSQLPHLSFSSGSGGPPGTVDELDCEEDDGDEPLDEDENEPLDELEVVEELDE